MQQDFLETPQRALAAAAASAGVDGGKRVFLYLKFGSVVKYLKIVNQFVELESLYTFKGRVLVCEM